jgi:hypothetical protein
MLLVERQKERRKKKDSDPKRSFVKRLCVAKEKENNGGLGKLSSSLRDPNNPTSPGRHIAHSF